MAKNNFALFEREESGEWKFVCFYEFGEEVFETREQLEADEGKAEGHDFAFVDLPSRDEVHALTEGRL
jgi:hypothetical protein